MRFVNDLVALASVASLVSASPYDWSQYAGQLSPTEVQCHGQCGTAMVQLRADDACRDCDCDNEELISLIKSCYVCATPNIQNIYRFRMSEAPPKCRPASNTDNATSEDADDATSEDAGHDHSSVIRDNSQDMKKLQEGQMMELKGTRDGKVQKEGEYEEKEDKDEEEENEEEEDEKEEEEAKDTNDEKEKANIKDDKKEEKNVSKEEKEEGKEKKMDDKKNEISSTLPTTSAAAGFGQSALIAVGITAALVLGMM